MRTKLSYALSADKILPDGWEWSTVGEVADVTAGNPAPQGAEFFEGGTKPFVRVQDMGRLGGAAKLHETHDHINDKAAKKLRLFPQGSVLFTKSGASTLLNQRAILARDMYVVSHIATAIPKESISSEWLYYWMRTIDFAYLAHATTLPSLPLPKAKAIPIPVPPPLQQKCIVAEIEKQFSRLDEAVTNLKRIKANLKRYKAAVLKAAVEGKLTEDWRKSHPNVEPASKLLARILTERRANWKGKGKYKEPDGADANGLPPPPKGWTWARLEQLGMIVGGLTKNPKRAQLTRKLPYLRVANVYANELRLDEIEQIGVQDTELKKLLLQKGDLLIVEGNGSKDQIGRLAIWDGSITPCVHQNHLIKVRLVIVSMDKWILFWLLSPSGRDCIEKVSSSTSGLYTLSVNKVGALPIIVPSLAEQEQITAEVERRLSIIEELEATVETNLTRANRLRQSVLSLAFRGEL